MRHSIPSSQGKQPVPKLLEQENNRMVIQHGLLPLPDNRAAERNRGNEKEAKGVREPGNRGVLQGNGPGKEKEGDRMNIHRKRGMVLDIIGMTCILVGWGLGASGNLSGQIGISLFGLYGLISSHAVYLEWVKEGRPK